MATTSCNAIVYGDFLRSVPETEAGYFETQLFMDTLMYDNCIEYHNGDLTYGRLLADTSDAMKNLKEMIPQILYTVAYFSMNPGNGADPLVDTDEIAAMLAVDRATCESLVSKDSIREIAWATLRRCKYNTDWAAAVGWVKLYLMDVRNIYDDVSDVFENPSRWIGGIYSPGYVRK